MHDFPELKSQEEIEIESWNIPLSWKIYFYASTIISFTLSIVIIVALLKWIFT